MHFSQLIVFFVQTPKKLTRGLLNFFEKYAKIMRFQQFSEENLFKIFENFLKTFLQIVFFVQSRKKVTQGLLNFFEKYAKIMHF